MKYVALLRGINVGGNNIIKMEDLRITFEKAGYTNVATFIQSGNVVFDSTSLDKEQITTHIESILSKTFHYSSRVVLRSKKEIYTTLHGVPRDWNSEKDLRCYILFVKEPLTANDVASDVELHEGIDFLSVGAGVLYMSTKMEGLTKSKFSKLIGKKVYKEVTTRNYKSARMIFELMEK
jgi:uncharacterized protein (DUF1697 family)